VYLVGMEDGVFPHSVALRDPAGLEEERRLCYVGMTRAMERLTITSAAERLRYGSRAHRVPPRVLAQGAPRGGGETGGGRRGCRARAVGGAKWRAGRRTTTTRMRSPTPASSWSHAACGFGIPTSATAW